MTTARRYASTRPTPTLTGGDHVEIGACRLEPFWFDQAAGEARVGSERDHAVTQAKAICASCPLTGTDGPCLRDNRKAPGVIAGMTHMERVQIGRVLPCGTPAAYLRHIRAGQEPCFPCRQAAARESAEKRARRKAAKGVAA